MICYEKLSKDLQAMGSVINPYDPCIANNTVNSKKITVSWHVDNLKLSHLDEREVTKLIKGLEVLYGEVRVTEGNKHGYLRMDLYFINKVKFKLIILTYLKGVL